MIHTRIDITTRFELEAFIQFAADYLGIVEEVSVNIFTNEALLERFSREGYEYRALLYATALPGAYNLVVRPRLGCAVIKEIAAHEMIHLSQYAAGRLKMDVASGRCIWEGKVFSNDIPYEERPWEKEAFGKEKDLLKAFRKRNRTKNK